MRPTRRPDAVLFRDMTLTQMDRLARSLTDGAEALRKQGEYDTCLDLHQVAADLDDAWWAKFARCGK